MKVVILLAVLLVTPGCVGNGHFRCDNMPPSLIAGCMEVSATMLASLPYTCANGADYSSKMWTRSKNGKVHSQAKGYVNCRN